jgi:hypothetical protein
MKCDLCGFDGNGNQELFTNKPAETSYTVRTEARLISDQAWLISLFHDMQSENAILKEKMENLRCGVKELISSLKLDEHQGDVLDSLDYFYISHPEFKAV